MARKKKVRCTKCRYDLTNMSFKSTKYCPECGKSTIGVLSRSIFEAKSAKKYR